MGGMVIGVALVILTRHVVVKSRYASKKYFESGQKFDSSWNDPDRGKVLKLMDISNTHFLIVLFHFDWNL